MTSLHRLLAILAVWAACASALFSLYGVTFLNRLSEGLTALFTALFLLAATAATFFIARSQPPRT